MAVLTAADYQWTTRLPYPTPFTETRTGFIVIADRVDTHPGFEMWDLDGQALNTAWAFHEIGHVIARDRGIGSGSPWIGELVANVVMAAYVRAERPQFDGFQSGLPARFATAARVTQLAAFDRIYFQMGQLNYLWFQFQIAAVADYLVAEGDFAAVMAALEREFPASRPRRDESVAATFARLERVRRGVTAFAHTLPWEI
jgi:hypothetical protein